MKKKDVMSNTQKIFKDTLSVLKSSEIAGIPHHLNAMIHLNDSIVIALNDSFLIEIRQKQIVKNYEENTNYHVLLAT